MADLTNYSSKSYYQFSFLKSDYIMLSAILHATLDVYIKCKSSWPSGHSSERIDKMISDLTELAWQLDTQVERQRYFDFKGV